MKTIELRKPVREEYANENEWLDACAIELRLYQRRMMQAIDATIPKTTPNYKGHDKLTEAERTKRDADTIHDYLQKHPALLQRYREIGIGCLLEI